MKPGASTDVSRAALLLLADGRFPAGGHAHSAGVESACANGAVRDVDSLAAFVVGRLHTAGRVDAAFAAAAARELHALAALDAALDARISSPRLREVSRALGRQALRAGERIWPHVRLQELRASSPPSGPHQSITYGVIAAAAGLGADDAALTVLHGLAASCATAAVRLLGLDPYAVHAMLASLGADIDALASAAVIESHEAIDRLPALSSPIVEILAEDHATWEVRLFAS
jgi:urease accessory protein